MRFGPRGPGADAPGYVLAPLPGLPEQTLNALRMMKPPSAFLPVGMSFAWLLTVLGYVAMYGARGRPTRGPLRISFSCS